MATRVLVLRSAGYLVESAFSTKEAVSQLRSSDFDLVALCHSMSPEDRDRLTGLIRISGSSIPVVTIAPYSDHLSNACIDGVIDSTPEGLLDGVETALQRAPKWTST